MMKAIIDKLFSNELIQNKEVKIGEDILYIHKYKKSVFYNNLWNECDVLQEARGTITDKNRIVVLPFSKVFNYKENNTILPMEQSICAVKKLNGFMGVYTFDSSYGAIYSTTGSIDSEFSKMVQATLDSIPNIHFFYNRTKNEWSDNSFLFEICHENDPHIIKEEYGAYLIGVRCTKSGYLYSESMLDAIANEYGFKRPEVIPNIKFSELLDLVKNVKHEGFMVRDDKGENNILLKLKSPYYLIKKFLIRSNPKTIFSQKYKTIFDEEFYEIVESIQEFYTIESWSELTLNERTNVVETLVNSYYS